MRKKHNISETPWLAAKKKMGGVRGRRATESIEICCALKKAEAFREPSSLILDLSQNVDRSPWSLGVRSLTTSSELFSFQLERILCASEHWKLLTLLRKL